jgi:hypothetical protein
MIRFRSRPFTAAVTTTTTPEPGTLWLVGSGLVGLVGLRRRTGECREVTRRAAALRREHCVHDDRTPGVHTERRALNRSLWNVYARSACYQRSATTRPAHLPSQRVQREGRSLRRRSLGLS